MKKQAKKPVKADAARIDYDSNNALDDISVPKVELFRMERMDDGTFWIRLYRKGQPDIIFWLNAKGKITGTHEFD